MTIDGGGQVTVMGGDGSGDFIVDPGAQTVLTGLTIMGGNGTSGGGIHNAGGLTVSDSTVSGNYGQSGGRRIQSLAR